MRKLLYLIPVVILVIVISTLRSESRNDTGIHFFEGTYAEALQQSKAQHKPIFIDIYATWCGPCKMLKNHTFTNKAVGDYFNAHFINVSFDGEQGDGAMLANKFHLSAYPTLIIIDGNEKKLMYEAGYYGPKELIKLVQGYAGY